MWKISILIIGNYSVLLKYDISVLFLIFMFGKVMNSDSVLDDFS